MRPKPGVWAEVSCGDGGGAASTPFNGALYDVPLYTGSQVEHSGDWRCSDSEAKSHKKCCRVSRLILAGSKLDSRIVFSPTVQPCSCRGMWRKKKRPPPFGEDDVYTACDSSPHFETTRLRYLHWLYLFHCSFHSYHRIYRVTLSEATPLS